jgi:enoyl-CoA hydratase
MPYENLLLTVEDRTGLLIVNRPKQLNALNGRTLMELLGALGEISGSDAVDAVILTGAGEKAFVAGADIAEMAGFSAQQARAFAELGHRVCFAFEEIDKPVIAAVNGFALGGGCELALACDFIYASRTARFGQPEVNLGVIPGFGGTQRLLRRVGKGRAKEIILGGENIDAAEALRIGLCNAVFEPADLLPRAREAAKRIGAKGPIAVAQAKRVLQAGEEMALASACELERQMFAAMFATEDQKEGMKAFLEKRPAAFKGH